MSLFFKIAKKQFQWLKPKYVAYQETWGFCYKELIAVSPFIFIADNFPVFSTGNQFCGLNRQ
jgi:hypothetical protein